MYTHNPDNIGILINHSGFAVVLHNLDMLNVSYKVEQSLKACLLEAFSLGQKKLYISSSLIPRRHGTHDKLKARDINDILQKLMHRCICGYLPQFLYKRDEILKLIK